MNRLTVQDIKQALWDERFRDLFPEYGKQIKSFLKDPGCGCNNAFLRSLLREKEKLKLYFPTKEAPEEDIKKVRNEWTVVNCDADEIADRMREFPHGKRLVAAARYENRVTLVLNDADAIFADPRNDTPEEILRKSRGNPMNWRVVNTTVHELEAELSKVPTGRKTIQICRFKDEVTAVINDLQSAF